MIVILRKLLFILIILNFCFSCVNSNYQNDLSKHSINISSPKNKYDILLMYELNRLLKTFVTKKKYDLYVEINFKSQSVLNIRGSDSLNEIVGVASFKLTDFQTNKLIKKGNINKKITYGSITSSYGRDENKNHIKERLAKSLSKNIYNNIKLYIN